MYRRTIKRQQLAIPELLSPSPLRGEGRDEGENVLMITPHSTLSLKGRGLLNIRDDLIFFHFHFQWQGQLENHSSSWAVFRDQSSTVDIHNSSANC
jgi:hypothetical protein